MTSPRRPALGAVAAAVLLGGALWGSPANATAFPGLDFEELVAKSDVIVRGVVVGKRAEWLDVTDRQRLATFYELRLDERVRGAVTASEAEAGRVRFALPGGVEGDVGQRVSGSVDLEVGDEVVLFLGGPGGPGGARGVLGLGIGVLRVRGTRLLTLPDVESPDDRPRRLDALRRRAALVPERSPR